MSNGRVLVVDDEPRIRRTLGRALTGHGYEVEEAEDGAKALEVLAERPVDVVVLDLVMPGIDGFAVLGRARAWSSVPIIVLSARGEEGDKVVALDLGADDYLTKPFGISELLARLRAVRRRATPSFAAPLAAGDVVIDLPRRRVTRGGEPVHLGPIEYALLAALGTQPGVPMTHRQIVEAVWGSFGTTPEEQARQVQLLRVHVTLLRRKLEADPRRPRLILTEPGTGYFLWAQPSDPSAASRESTKTNGELGPDRG